MICAQPAASRRVVRMGGGDVAARTDDDLAALPGVAAALAEHARASRAEISRERRLPPALAAAIADAGFFRLLVPRCHGGRQLDFRRYLPLLRTLAEADASVGWCVNQANVFAVLAASMPAALAERIFADPRAALANGPPRGAAARRAGSPADVTSAGDGYLVSGRWEFSSGCQHATWIAALSPVRDAAGNTVDVRHFYVPRAEVAFIDDWATSGLRGTGSFSFEFRERLVPAADSAPTRAPPRVDDPLYRLPQNLLFAAGFACVALGAARSALDAAVAFARERSAQGGKQSLAHSEVVQQDVGRAEALLRAAGALLDVAVEAAWAAAARAAPDLRARLDLRLASTHAIRQAADVADIAYRLCGSLSVLEATGVHRPYQDVHAITQQLQGRMSHYGSVGQWLLGLEPRGLF
jgi:alkylation response protein AidB-like acyl-CoA dehydrogenase